METKIGEWIDFTGTGCPVDDDTIVQVEFLGLDGFPSSHVRAGDMYWKEDSKSHIVRYRVIKQTNLPAPAKGSGIESMFDLLLANQIELADAKARLAQATSALEDLERINAGGGSAYRSIQILSRVRS